MSRLQSTIYLVTQLISFEQNKILMKKYTSLYKEFITFSVAYFYNSESLNCNEYLWHLFFLKVLHDIIYNSTSLQNDKQV